MTDIISVPAGDLVAQVGQKLLDAILRGDLGPGSRISEAEQARRLDVSRGPVREACRRLEERGLLVSVPRRGFFVRDWTMSEIDGLYELRVVLERFCVSKAAELATRADVERLNKSVQAMRQSASHVYDPAFVDSDFEFHLQIARISGNERLIRSVGDLGAELKTIISLIGRSVDDDPLWTAETHLPIIEAIEAGDPSQAADRVEFHISDAWRRMREKVISGRDLPLSQLRRGAAS